MRFRKRNAGTRNGGYALIAAILILGLLAALEMLALATSSSEVSITNNMSEDQMMFNFGEEGVERILSHLHYKTQGLFGIGNEGLNESTTNPISITNLLPRKVWDANVPDLYLNYTWEPGGPPFHSTFFMLSAWLDPEDRKELSPNTPDLRDVSPTRGIAISVAVTNNLQSKGYSKGFRALVRPTSIWDLAYFSQNHSPSVRRIGDCSVSETASQNWYDCQPVFHKEDSIDGNVFVRNADAEYDDGHPFFRGGPVISGQVRWRSILGYGKEFQTKGGSASGVAGPTSGRGMMKQSKEIGLFPIKYVTGTDDGDFRQSADIILPHQDNVCGENGRHKCIWKIIFRNDYDWDKDGIYEESREASHISREINNGTRADPDDPGAFVLYRLPYETETEIRAALFGDTANIRHQIMTNYPLTHNPPGSPPGVSGEIFSPSTVGWPNDVLSSGGCYRYRDNRPDVQVNPLPAPATVYATLKPYDANDIRPGQGYYVFVQPSVGLDMSSVGSAWGAGVNGGGTCPAATGGVGGSSGIIFVEGDLLVSGVSDGKTTIVATGDIILDHEVQYEEHPYQLHNDDNDVVRTNPNDIDMLTLIATGSVIIPNSYPRVGATPASCTDLGLSGARCVYMDDWSDPEYIPMVTAGDFRPRGLLDAIEDRGDDGNEEIHAIMVSLGRRPCTYGPLNCPAMDPDHDTDDELKVRNFNVGVYATPRTLPVAPAIWGLPRGNFYTNSGGEFDIGGNTSGTLTVWGAIIQNYSGRLSYDHNSSNASGCVDGAGTTCRNMGHRLSLYHDPHLKYSMPAMPYNTNSQRVIPYGMAAWEINSWERISTSRISEVVW